jgi:amidase
MDRRAFLQQAALAAGLGAAEPSAEVDEITIDEIGRRMSAGRLTARSLAESYLARIARNDRQGASLRAVIELNPDALAAADALDRERRDKGARGPLHGVPILIKDNIDTADKMQTTAGSLALAGSIAARDAWIVEKLRAAGAVILGKTNLSEWANFRSTHSVSGWSGRGGQARNPYALDRNPCGSSSGSGVAVSANLCAAAVGTETDGSVVCPSSINGIVGIKPTLGLLSRSGIVPIAHSQDTAGPMARTVRDAAILLGAMAGPDPGDDATAAGAGKAAADYTKYLDPHGLRGARLGVARKFFGTNADVDRVIEEAIAALRREGAEIVEGADMPSHGKLGDPEFEVLLWEFKSDLNRYLGALPASVRVRSLADLIAFNDRHRREEMPYFQQEILLKAQEKGPLTEKAYLDALALCRKLSRDDGIDAVVREHRLDAIVAPTAGPAWLIDWVNGDHDTGGCSTAAAVAGYPHVTVPAGFVRGLPVGLSFFGAAWSEPVLLKVAYSFEQATKARRAPRMLPSVVFSA